MKLDRKVVFKLAKGYSGRNKNCYAVAVKRVQKGLQYAFRDRRVKKRIFKQRWISTINAGVREHGVGYGPFIHSLYEDSNIALDRKVLAHLAATEPFSFQSIVSHVKDTHQVPTVKAPDCGLLYSAIVQTPKIDYHRVMEMELADRRAQEPLNPVMVFDEEVGRWVTRERTDPGEDGMEDEEDGSDDNAQQKQQAA